MRPRIRPFDDRDAGAVVALSRRTISSGRWPRRPPAGRERRVGVAGPGYRPLPCRIEFHAYRSC